MVKYLKKSVYGNENKQLILLPFAGGYSNSFKFVTSFVPDDWEIISFDPPGHGPNTEPLIENADQLLNWYIEQISHILTPESVIMGHSLGGMMSYLLTKILINEGKRPKQLVMSATMTPDLVQERSKLSSLDDDQLLNYIIKLEGVPEEIIDQTDLLKFFLPIFRSDFKVLESLPPFDDKNFLDIPTILFSGTNDDTCPYQEVDKWREYTLVEKHLLLPGGHMFITNHAKYIFDLIFKGDHMEKTYSSL